MRTMNTEKLLKTVPIIQNQMDVLLDFNVSFLWSHFTCVSYLLCFGGHLVTPWWLSGGDFLSDSSPKTDLILKIPNLSCSYSLSTFPCLFQVNANELTNGVINAAFMLLFKDAIRLFAAYNEGIINLLGKDKLLLLAYINFTLQLFGL